MDQVILRIPFLAESIFAEADNNTLAKCKIVGETWARFIDMKKVKWVRIILKYAGNMTEFADYWRALVRRVPVKIVKEIALTVEDFFFANPKRKDYQWSPFVIAADRGHLELYQFILDELNQNNLPQVDQTKALKFAAMGGHIDVCKFIIEHFSKKNPSIDLPMTYSLHCAARYGQLEVFKLLTECTSDKNPQCNFGWTPLHEVVSGGHLNCYDFTTVALHRMNHINVQVNVNAVDGALPIALAANEGHLEICRFLIENIADKNPSNMNGTTALHVAAWFGQLEACKLIIEDAVDKNPQNHFGQTPLHLAANAGQLEICRLIIDSVEDKNPDINGWTPLHEAVCNGHLQVCKFIVENTHEVIDKERLISWASMHGHIKLCKFLINGEKDCETNFNSISQLLFISVLTILFGSPTFSRKWIFYILAAKCFSFLVTFGPLFCILFCIFFGTWSDTVLNDPLSFGYSVFGTIGILALYFPFLVYVFDPMLDSYLRYKWKIPSFGN